MDNFWRVANYFHWHPSRAFVVSLIFWFLLLFSYILRGWRPQVRLLPLLVVALTWLFSGCWSMKLIESEHIFVLTC